MPDIHDSDMLAPDALDVLAAVAPLAPTAWTSAVWLDNLARMNAQVATFIADRACAAVETQLALLQCRSLTDLQHVQAAFVQKAVAQYQAEAGQMVAMTARLASDLHVRPDASAG